MRATRPPAEMWIGNSARMANSAAERHDRIAAENEAIAREARSDLARIHTDACERFDLDLPLDPFLLDVLELIDVAPANRWLWRGTRNNKGVPTIRHQGHELSLTRYLAIQLGVISGNEFGTLYPVEGDTEDVNPFHRDLRRAPRPTGNPYRFAGHNGSPTKETPDAQ